MSFEDAIKVELLKLLNKWQIPATEVLSWRDDTESGGCCETCFYTVAIVEIEFRSEYGREDTYTYYGDFADLIREMTNDS